MHSETNLAQLQALLVPMINASTEEMEHGSDYKKNHVGDNKSTQGHKTSATKAKAVSKTRDIKVTRNQAFSREGTRRGTAIRGHQAHHHLMLVCISLQPKQHSELVTAARKIRD